MILEKLYQETIEKLKRDERPLIKLTEELIAELKSEWQKAISGVNNNGILDEEKLKKIMCILDNTQNMSAQFNELFFTTLAKLKEGDLLIYTLAASQKHVVEEALKTGVMIPGIYFDQLKKLLESKNPEVLEWTLRTIETMGPLSMRFKNEVKNIRPSFLKMFNQHQKSALQIVELLEKQWKNVKL